MVGQTLPVTDDQWSWRLWYVTHFLNNSKRVDKLLKLSDDMLLYKLYPYFFVNDYFLQFANSSCSLYS